ncbi:phosphate ABC transporter permease PstA [Litoribrevibacter albus]|uniref:Phosphate transport system permease protein PstA n=1 Tax=Litoribrevibacter albus TaxID=1473156 RepID=A0AA37W941_9GAMM|nr:phosphate ABC transporter permease PstA [Litoribrevibacter albus]GLQ32789.1 phosphate transport system permease protein PstA [Litoribrevibacter albus]
MNVSVKDWFKSGSPWVWLNAGAVSLCVIMVLSLLGLIAIRGLGHFWPSNIYVTEYQNRSGEVRTVLGEKADHELVSAVQLKSAGYQVPEGQEYIGRQLLKVGNRDVYGQDFQWVLDSSISSQQTVEDLIVLERREWGNFYGSLVAVKESGNVVSESSKAGFESTWAELEARLERALALHDEIHSIEKGEIGSINYGLERLRLKERGLELSGDLDPIKLQLLAEERAELDAEYEVLKQELNGLYQQSQRDQVVVKTIDGKTVEMAISKVVLAYAPNNMNVFEKSLHYIAKLGEFLLDDPREANTEGGIYPAIFGTVMMVLLMSIMVTPFGVVAAVYLREYAKQGPVTRIIRIAVNNLAGVPSIVYGVFGLGFFIYFLGGSIDQLFYPEALPAPTFGTPGLLWASLTLAILTVPVVIVATEEGLSRIPRAVREGSLALGATKFETLWKVVLPMSSPAIMTGVILAIARAAGEVAPLMLVGVVKLAPSLPLDGNFPFLHLDRKFMHLGFHIYDVGFQSPNVEAARPLVYATALLLVVVIAVLNLAAVAIRNNLREKYKSLEH